VRYACTVAELRAGGGMRPITLGAREVLVVGTDDGIRAVDRSCPHEGFRLDAGEVRGQELTCPAHGWRFDLRSGACVTAGEDIRTYTVDVRDGAIFVDVDVAPTDQELTLASEAVLGALETGRGSLAARRTARLLALGEDPRRVALLLARYGGSHADAGLDPETAAVADALALVPHLDERAVALVFADVASALAARLARASPRFGPDPATHSHCTLGGMLGNDSCGVHSVFSEFYGPGPRTSDHVEELDVVTYGGERVRARATDELELRRVHSLGGRIAQIYDRLLALRDRHSELCSTPEVHALGRQSARGAASRRSRTR